MEIGLNILLSAIVVILLIIAWRLGNIDSRLKERFPTAEEEDLQWAQRDPHGHYEAHKDDN